MAQTDLQVGRLEITDQIPPAMTSVQALYATLDLSRADFHLARVPAIDSYVSE